MLKNILRVIFIIVILGIIGYAWLAISTSATCSKKEVDNPELEPPYYIAATSSLPYAGKSIDDQGEVVIINPPYYVMFKKKWVIREGTEPLLLTESVYGPIQVTLVNK